MARPVAVLADIDRARAEAEKAIEEGKAFLARRAEMKQADARDLAGRSVAELRRLAARCGVKGSRTMRKEQLLAVLAM
jgi:hypothetical protein